MKTSQNGINLIKRFEGLELESYQDIAGIWTIGYGQTGEEIGPNQKITEPKAEALLVQDLEEREKAIIRLVKVTLNQNQFDALASFIYNVGIGAFKRSTALKRLNKKDYNGAAEALTWFDKATIDGVLKPVTGLIRRRIAEKTLFLTEPTLERIETPNNPLKEGFEIDQITNITPINDTSVLDWLYQVLISIIKKANRKNKTL